MPKTLTFLHTSPVHIATFDLLLAELAPNVPVRHVVAERLLQDARAFGLTDELARQVRAAVDDAFADGAGLLVCTCSTIGGCAQAAQSPGRPVLRIDRPMAERAVALGSRIIIAAALESTLAPTRELLREAAQSVGRDVVLTDLLCAHAWVHFERGDRAAYLAQIAQDLRTAAPRADVIVLAQASMAGVVDLVADLPVPVLSSPRLGLEAALRAFSE